MVPFVAPKEKPNRRQTRLLVLILFRYQLQLQGDVLTDDD